MAEQLESVLDATVKPSTNFSSYRLAEAYREFVLDYRTEILSLVIALVGLVGNSIVLWLLAFLTQRSPFSVYILNLAMSDAIFLGSYFGLCMWAIVGDLDAAVLELILVCILHMSYCVGLSLLAAISTERCLSVLFPLWYRCHRPKHTSAAVCAILWALQGLYWGIIVALHFLINFHTYFYRFLFFIQFGWFSLLTCVLGVSSLTLVLRVQCSSQRRHPPRLYVLVLLTVLVFLLCGLPWGINDAASFFRNSSSMHLGASRLLACVNSSANPFIYFFLGSQWRRRGREPLRVVLQRALGEEQVGGFEEKDTSHPNTVDKNKRLRQGRGVHEMHPFFPHPI
ncbi:mas-related G-protein coupled receptor member X1-like [Monodelphis domestica]|uniref:mas-related G-protein coupled receptor member X1-like n=1 Tax=Monodelphis domestica TaxID=13616 RepID=UPI0000F2C994|nr:mas-related G-protein coupled receptor member X1-like [Monodelphis domestica]